MKRILLLFLTLTLLIFPKPSFAHSSLQIIEMTPDGFSPTEITVDENSTVLFVNKDNEDRWPASNIHPTHEIYPELDPKQPIKPGESWSFKPTRIGEFKFHDHIKAHLRGVLTVVAESDGVGQPNNGDKSSSIDLFKGIGKWFEEIIDKAKDAFGFLSKKSSQKIDLSDISTLPVTDQHQRLKLSIDSIGSEATWQKIKEVFKGQAGSSGNIHDIAHLTGKLMYEKDGFSGIKYCSSEFAFGCYHGFLDTAFAKSLDKLVEAQEACLKLDPASQLTGPVASCIHGIGHGVASFYATNDLKKSLASCRKLNNGAEYCYDGVFMEYVRSAPETTFKRDDPLYPCNEIEHEFGYMYSFACGRNQPALLMGRFKMGFDEVIGVCNVSDSAPFKQACFDSLGFSVASSGNSDQIIMGCRKISEDEYVARCLEAAAGELIFQEVPGWNESSQKVCAASPQESKCIEHIRRLTREYGRQVTFNFPTKTADQDLSAYIREQLEVCYGGGGRDGCYKQLADVFYKQFGLKTTLASLKENENYPEVYARCHEVTHYLSRSEYETQKDIAKVYAKCDSTCHGGCYHGTLEAYLKDKIQSESDVGSHFAKICGQESDYQKPLEYNECLHGLGHAAMFVTEMELKDSLKMCDSLDNDLHRERCYTGVFMENSSSSTSADHGSKYIKLDDPFYPCNSLEEKYQPLCWQYQSSYFSIITGQNWSKVAEYCVQIPEKYQDKCFRTIGTNQVGFTQSLEVMKQGCDLMPSPNFKNICVSGVISSLSYRFVGEVGKMSDFCSLVDEENKEICYKQIGTSLAEWDKDKNVAKGECGKIDYVQGRNWCLNVI